MAAIAAEREQFLADLLLKARWRPQFNERTPQPVVDALHPYTVLNGEWLNGMPRWGGARWVYPASHLLRVEGRDPGREFLPDDESYEAACDRLEVLASFVACDPETTQRNLPWMGEFVINGQSLNDGKGLAAQVGRGDWRWLADARGV